MQGAFIKSSVGPGAFGRMSATGGEERPKSEVNTIAGGPATWSNPTGRVSVQFAPGAVSHPSLCSRAAVWTLMQPCVCG